MGETYQVYNCAGKASSHMVSDNSIQKLLVRGERDGTETALTHEVIVVASARSGSDT